MGILSRIFSKKEELETLELIDNQMDALLKKSGANFMSLVGIKGKVKGLEILTVLNSNCKLETKDIRLFNAKLAEYFLRNQKLDLYTGPNAKPMQYAHYYYADDAEFYIIPLEQSTTFVITAMNGNIEKVIKNLEKINLAVIKLRED